MAYALEPTVARWTNPRYSREAEPRLQIAKSAVDRNPTDDGERFLHRVNQHAPRLDVSTVACIPYAAMTCKRRALKRPDFSSLLTKSMPVVSIASWALGYLAMAMGRSDAVQGDLMATWAEMPRSPGHAFYDRLQEPLREAGFDAFVEDVCKPHYAPRMGAPSLPPGRYFRMHMIGDFEGIDSERGLAWRCANSSRCAISCGCRTARRFR